MRGQLRRFRPMSISDILDETVELYRSNFVLLMGIAAGLSIPFLLAQSVIQPRFHYDYNPYALLTAFIKIFSVYILLWFVTQIVTGAITFAVSESYLGRKTTIGSCYRRVFSSRVFFPLFGAVLLKSMLIAAPVFMLFSLIGVAGFFVSFGHNSNATLLALLGIGIPVGLGAAFLTIYLSLRFMLLEPALIVEMKGVAGSLTRAWRLVQGNMLKVLGVTLIAGLVVSAVSAMLLMPLQMAAFGSMLSKHPGSSHVLPAISAVFSALLQTLLMPIVPIVVILLYYDVRIRKEGFDLELLASELDARTQHSGEGPNKEETGQHTE